MPIVPGFLPSTVAPLFPNGPWPPGMDLRVSVPGLPTVALDVTHLGLCGGDVVPGQGRLREWRTPAGVTIVLDVQSRAPVSPVVTNGTGRVGSPGRVRGLFVLLYEFVDPAPAYLQEARWT